MQQPEPVELVKQIHSSDRQMVLAVTGGGSGAVSTLLQVPGASRSVLEAIVPYAPPAMAELLGFMPDQLCSERTARQMGMAGYMRALKYGGDSRSSHTLGISASCSLASDRAKRGAHRIFAACQCASATVSWSLELNKGRRTRAEEEALASKLILNLVAEACGLDDRLELQLDASEQLQTARADAPAAWQDLLAGRTQIADLQARQSYSAVLFPGAFNPLHDGHRAMASMAEARLARPVLFEISVLNVDKPPLDFVEMRNRAAQFGGEFVFTRAPTFLEKSELFPGATFVVGSDTLRRIGEPRYYGGAAQLHAAIQAIAQRGCKFLVFGRNDEGEFRTVDQLDIPKTLEVLCTQVPQSEFQMDVSSTELRRDR